jgi:hypothetical protein
MFDVGCSFIFNPVLTPEIDSRIQTLTTEILRLRNSRHQADNELQALLLKITEIQLNLATQDRTLNKLDSAIMGNGSPGILTRVDRTERVLGTLVKSVWLLASTFAAGLARVLMDRWK